MQLGMVGLGRMGANIVRRLERAGHQCVVYRPQRRRGRGFGRRRRDRRDLARRSGEQARRAARGVVHGPGRHHRPRSSTSSPALLSPGDIVIDGGNSNYRDDIARGAALATQAAALRRLRNERRRLGSRTRVLPDDRRPRTTCSRTSSRSSARSRRASMPRRARPGRTGEPAPEEHGYLHCGPPGAGHFVKMVHNGIEYALMECVRRRSQRPAPRERGAEGHGRVRRRDRAAARARAVSLRDRSRRGQRGVAARQRDRVVAARPHRGVAARVARPRRVPGPRQRQRRRPLDGAGRGRRGRAGAADRATRCSVASRHAARPSSVTACSRRCAASSAATASRRRPPIEPTRLSVARHERPPRVAGAEEAVLAGRAVAAGDVVLGRAGLPTPSGSGR